MPQYVNVEKHRFAAYIKKADEFFQSLKEAVQAGRWEAAGLAAIHCVISSSDALTTYHLQQRSASERHQDAAQLLKRLPLPGGLQDKIKQFIDVLEMKNQVEYDAVPTSEKDALQMAKQAERFYSWAKANLPK
ncbi:HEPN domain-containing protein [Candidatus Micrarchaeota archaeon]|nr:HEPN domain-containing protein [Candidatus Micrarchaeota archaeon]